MRFRRNRVKGTKNDDYDQLKSSDKRFAISLLSLNDSPHPFRHGTARLTENKILKSLPIRSGLPPIKNLARRKRVNIF